MAEQSSGFRWEFAPLAEMAATLASQPLPSGRPSADPVGYYENARATVKALFLHIATATGIPLSLRDPLHRRRETAAWKMLTAGTDQTAYLHAKRIVDESGQRAILLELCGERAAEYLASFIETRSSSGRIGLRAFYTHLHKRGALQSVPGAIAHDGRQSVQSRKRTAADGRERTYCKLPNFPLVVALTSSLKGKETGETRYLRRIAQRYVVHVAESASLSLDPKSVQDTARELLAWTLRTKSGSSMEALRNVYDQSFEGRSVTDEMVGPRAEGYLESFLQKAGNNAVKMRSALRALYGYLVQAGAIESLPKSVQDQRKGQLASSPQGGAQ